jgi:hypothetical protein
VEEVAELEDLMMSRLSPTFGYLPSGSSVSKSSTGS